MSTAEQEASEPNRIIIQRVQPVVPHNPSRLGVEAIAVAMLRRSEKEEKAEFVCSQANVSRSADPYLALSVSEANHEVVIGGKGLIHLRAEPAMEFPHERAALRRTGNGRFYCPDAEMLRVT